MSRLLKLRAAVAAELASASVPHLSLANNTFTIKIDGNNKIVTKLDAEGVAYCDVHFVDANENISKLYYKDKFSNDEDKQVAPTCFSDNGVKPSDQSEAKQSDFCGNCPHNVWGSAISETGAKAKSCRDAWKTAVVVPSFSDTQLLQLRIPPASLKAWNAYNATFAEFQLEHREGMIGDAITRVFFVPGKQGIIEFEPISLVEEGTPQFNYLLEVAEKNLAANLIGVAPSAPALMPPPNQPKVSYSPKPVAQIEDKSAYEVAEEEGTVQAEAEATGDSEENVEARIRAQVTAEMQARKQVSALKSEAIAGKAPALGVAKTPKAASAEQPVYNLKKPLGDGMRKLGGGAVAGGVKVSSAPATAVKKTMGSLMAKKPDAVDAEVVPEVKKTTPQGIPSAAKLPGALADLLAGVMGK